MASMLLHKAIGDAVGMHWEFVEHDQTVQANDLFYKKRVGFKEYKPGSYTDDTQMALANAVVLLKFKDISKITEDDFVNQWLETYHQDPRAGYSSHMKFVMENSYDPKSFRKNIGPATGSSGGAAMRAEVFGLLPDVFDVLRLAEMQAKITHNSEAGVNSAKAVALAAHYLHYGGDRKGLFDYVGDHLGNDWLHQKRGFQDSPSNAINIVGQAFEALQSSNSMEEILLNAINIDVETDTDTVCSLAMSLSSIVRDINLDLNDELHEDLENGKFGYEHLTRIDNQLSLKFPKKDYQFGQRGLINKGPNL